MIKQYKEKIYTKTITRSEIDEIKKAPLDELICWAQKIREDFLENQFDVCSIINGKSGKCSENCKFCAQSSHYKTKAKTFDLVEEDDILKEAVANRQQGVSKFSVVTSGRKLSENELQALLPIYKKLEQLEIYPCASHGLLSFDELKSLHQAGVKRYHNNLETSRNFFPKVCSTHTYDDKISTLKNAKKAGLSICSGGIWGLGETLDDRLDMAIELRDLDVTSVPINLLAPIAGTPFENYIMLDEKEIIRTLCLYRMIHPDSFLRLAGGRGQLKDHGKKLMDISVNACITGDMLTTAGYTIQSDTQMIQNAGFKLQ